LGNRQLGNRQLGNRQFTIASWAIRQIGEKRQFTIASWAIRQLGEKRQLNYKRQLEIGKRHLTLNAS
jgi:hypothetical protein